MSKYDKTKNYWMQVKEDWFDDEAIKWLEEQPSGEYYSNFYMKLCLKSIRMNGFLIRKVGNMYIPFDASTLSELTRMPIKIVKNAVKMLEQIGLIQFKDDGAIYIESVQSLTIVSTKSSEKRAEQRSRKLDNGATKGRQLLPANGTDCRPQLTGTINNKQLTDTSVCSTTQDTTHTDAKNQPSVFHEDTVVKTPTLAEVQVEIYSNNYEVDAEHFWGYYERSKWVDKNGRIIEHWRQKLFQWHCENAKKTKPQNTQETKQETSNTDWDFSRFEVGGD